MEKTAKTSKDLETLRQDIGKLQSDLSEILHAIKDDNKVTLEDLKMNLFRASKDIEERAQQSVHSAYENLAQQTQKAIGKARVEVTKRPLVIVLFAVFAGIVIGKLSRS